MILRINKLLLSFYFLITSLLASVILITNLTPLYTLSIKWFDLSNFTGVSAQGLMEDYKSMVKYIQLPWMDNLQFKNFAMSEQGAYHFYEVKNIFFNVYALFFMCLILGLVFYYLNKKGWLKVSVDSLNYFFYITVSLIVLTLAGFYMNFTMLFNKFHELFFNNNYWIFDPRTDPIILALPEEFFTLCAVAIVLTTLLIAVVGKVIYSRRKVRVSNGLSNIFR